MSTDLERRLADAFSAEADRAHLLNPDRPAPRSRSLHVSPARPNRRRWRRPVAVAGWAAVAAAVIGAVVVVSQRGDSDRIRPADSVPATSPTPTDASPVTTEPSPVDSAPETTVTPTDPAPATTASVPVDSQPATIPTTPTAPSLWVELEPGATAPLPPAPIRARNGSTMVWTGSEVIVWGGIHEDERLDDSSFRESREGAAFDPAAGTWRPIASPPDGVVPGVVLWAGTEMFVWSDGTPDSPSAAYDPGRDTWRLVADPPVAGSVAFWTGEEALLIREPDADNDGFVDTSSASSYAYDPATDSWRRLADGPWGVPVGWVSGPSTSAVWTGTTVITMTDTDSDDGILLDAYDPATDTWRPLGALENARQPVVISDRSGSTRTVAFLPLETETPVELLDDQGNEAGEWAGRPPELASTCAKPADNDGCLLTSVRALSVGGEVLFWYSNDGWAFDPATQAWRSLPLDGRQPGWDGTEVVAVGDLLFAWGADRDGLVYRAATTG